MTQDLKSAVESWKAADAQARAAERELRRARADYQSRRGGPIPEGLAKAVDELRLHAKDKLVVALALMKPDRLSSFREAWAPESHQD